MPRTPPKSIPSARRIRHGSNVPSRPLRSDWGARAAVPVQEGAAVDAVLPALLLALQLCGLDGVGGYCMDGTTDVGALADTSSDVMEGPQVTRNA
jgi:hypothetical protein